MSIVSSVNFISNLISIIKFIFVIIIIGAIIYIGYKAYMFFANPVGELVKGLKDIYGNVKEGAEKAVEKVEEGVQKGAELVMKPYTDTIKSNLDQISGADRFKAGGDCTDNVSDNPKHLKYVLNQDIKCVPTTDCKKGFNKINGICISSLDGTICKDEFRNKPYATLYDKDGNCTVKSSNICVDGFKYDTVKKKCISNNSGLDCKPSSDIALKACLACDIPKKGDINTGMLQVYDDEGYCTIPKTLTCIDRTYSLQYNDPITKKQPYCKRPSGPLGSVLMNIPSQDNPYIKPFVDMSNIGAGIGNSLNKPLTLNLTEAQKAAFVANANKLYAV